MKNTLFHYQYRDASNYKVQNSIVFGGPPSREAKERVLRHQEEFLPGQVGIPSLQDQMITPADFSESGDDHVWHEVLEIEEITKPADNETTFEEFAARFPESDKDWNVIKELARVGAT